MENPRKDIDELLREIDSERTAVTRSSDATQTSGFGVVVTLAGGLLVLGLAVTYAQMLGRQSVTRLTAGSIGGAAGLLVGYAIGRQKEGRRD